MKSVLLDTIEEYKLTERLVALCYDGATSMSGSEGGVHCSATYPKRVRKSYSLRTGTLLFQPPISSSYYGVDWTNHFFEKFF